MIVILIRRESVVTVGSHPDSADLVRELEEEEDGDHDTSHDEADEGPVGEHGEGRDELDGQWGLIFWGLNKDWKNKPVSCVPRIPVFPKKLKIDSTIMYPSLQELTCRCSRVQS